MNRQTLYNHLYNVINKKEVAITICIALGLDLVMSMILLMAKGFTLNPLNETDRKTMEFIDTHKGDNFTRLLSYYDYMNK